MLNKIQMQAFRAWLAKRLPAVDMVEVIERRIAPIREKKLRSDGRKISFLCPFHDDHKPAILIEKLSDGTAIFMCRSPKCQFSWKPMNAYQLLRATGRDFSGACKILFGRWPTFCRYCGTEIYLANRTAFENECCSVVHVCRGEKQATA